MTVVEALAIALEDMRKLSSEELREELDLHKCEELSKALSEASDFIYRTTFDILYEEIV